jgi:MFS family permease
MGIPKTGDVRGGTARPGRWRIFFASLVVVFIVTGVRQPYSVFIEPLTVEFGWSRAAVSLPYSLLILFWGLSQPFIGRLIDVRGARRVIAVCIVLGSVALLLTAFIQELWQLSLVYGLLLGLTTAGGSIVAFNVLLGPWFDERNRAKVFAACHTAIPASAFLFAPLAFGLITAWSWRHAMFVFGLLTLLTLPVLLTWVREAPAQVQVRRDRVAGRGNEAFWVAFRGEVQRALLYRPFLYLFLAYSACGFTSFFFAGHIAAVATSRGFSPAVGAMAAGLAGISSAVGGLACGVLADRFSRSVVLASTYLARGVGFLLLGYLTIESPLAFYLTTVVVSFPVFGTAAITNALAYEMFGGRGAGLLLGLAFTLHQVGGFLGTLSGGAVFDWTGEYTLMFLVGTVLLLSSSLLS